MTKLKILSLLDGDTIDPKKIANLKNTKIFSFDILSQKFLEKRNLEYFFADDQLTIEERKKIFDHVVSKLYWYEDTSLNCDPLLIDGYNFLQMLDPLYLHQKLLVTLLQFNMIKKIIEFEKPVILKSNESNVLDFSELSKTNSIFPSITETILDKF